MYRYYNFNACALQRLYIRFIIFCISNLYGYIILHKYVIKTVLNYTITLLVFNKKSKTLISYIDLRVDHCSRRYLYKVVCKMQTIIQVLFL